MSKKRQSIILSLSLDEARSLVRLREQGLWQGTEKRALDKIAQAYVFIISKKQPQGVSSDDKSKADSRATSNSRLGEGE